MRLEELTERLDAIAWHEQTDRELQERPGTAHAPPTGVEPELRALAAQLDSRALDALERTDGYLVWALRLAPFIEPGAAAERAARHLDDPEWDVRHWARALVRPAS